MATKTTSSKKLLHLYCAGVLLLTWLLSVAMQAQTYSVLYTFTDGADGGIPLAGVTLDSAGNLYGTTSMGAFAYGTAFRLKRSGAIWTFELLHAFTGSPDGATPLGRVVFGPDGALYGTTSLGGVNYVCRPDNYTGCGTVFRLRPPASPCGSASCPWRENVVYTFLGDSDGDQPEGDLTFDSQGNLYGTTPSGGVVHPGGKCLANGDEGCGTVYQLAPSGSRWTHTVLHEFHGPDGAYPGGGVILDAAGNLYGTTDNGGASLGREGCFPGCGVAYELSPSINGWSEHTIHNFTDQGDGAYPGGGLIFDPSGNLLGTATSAGTNGGGTAFELTNSNGQWNLSWLTDSGSGSYSGLTRDPSGNLYGATDRGGRFGYGTVFKLIPANGGWAYQDLHDFTNGADGAYPSSNVSLDTNGNLYGTAEINSIGAGVVWEITP